MSCAYRTAATRIATIAGIPLNLMLTAMDIARQQRATFPALPPDRLPTITQLLGMNPTCGNPQQVIARTQAALLVLSTLHPAHPCIERWMAVAALLGVPEDYLPIPAHPEIMATVRAQWEDSPPRPPRPARSRCEKGLAALWDKGTIPSALIDEAVRADDRTTIVTWMTHGVWDDRFTDICRYLTDKEIGAVMRAGVVTDAIAEQAAQRWWSKTIPWDVFTLTMWDRVTDPETAREGRARTAAMTLIHHPTFRDVRLIAAAAEMPWSAGRVLVKRTDLTDDRLIAAVAEDAAYARDVLVARHDLSDPQLIAAVAEDGAYARDVLVARHDLSDPQLIAAVAEDAVYACDVLVARHDLTDDRLIAVVAAARDSRHPRTVLIERPDLTDDLLIAAVAAARDPQHPRTVLIERPDLTDDRLIAAVTKNAKYARDVLVARHDLTDDRLIAAVAQGTPSDAYEVLCVRHDLSDDRLIDAVAAAADATYARDILIARPDLRTNTRLLTAIAHHRAMVDSVLAQIPELRDHPILAAALNADRPSA